MKKIILISLLITSFAAQSTVYIEQYTDDEVEQVDISIGVDDDFLIWKPGHPLFYSFSQMEKEFKNKFKGYKIEKYDDSILLEASIPTGVRYQLSPESVFAGSGEFVKALKENKISYLLNGKKMASTSAVKYFDHLSLCVASKVSKNKLPEIFLLIAKRACENTSIIKVLEKIDLSRKYESGNISFRHSLKFCRATSSNMERKMNDSFKKAGWIEKNASRTQLTRICKENFVDRVYGGIKKDILLDKEDIIVPIVEKHFSISSNSGKSLFSEFETFISAQNKVVKTDVSLHMLTNSKEAKKLYENDGVRDFDTLAMSTFIKSNYYRAMNRDKRSWLSSKLIGMLKESCQEGAKSLQTLLDDEKAKEKEIHAEHLSNYKLVKSKYEDYLACIDADHGDDSYDNADDVTTSYSDNSGDCDELTSLERKILELGISNPKLRDINLSCLDQINTEKIVEINLNGSRYLWVK